MKYLETRDEILNFQDIEKLARFAASPRTYPPLCWFNPSSSEIYSSLYWFPANLQLPWNSPSHQRYLYVLDLAICVQYDAMHERLVQSSAVHAVAGPADHGTVPRLFSCQGPRFTLYKHWILYTEHCIIPLCCTNAPLLNIIFVTTCLNVPIFCCLVLSSRKTGEAWYSPYIPLTGYTCW